MKRIVVIGIFLMLVSGIESGFGQNFTNLNFESANVPDVPAGQFGSDVSVTLGMPGWTAAPVTAPNLIGHNNFSTGGAFVAIQGPQWPSSEILQGNYSAYIAGSEFSGPGSAYIAQTGQIPQNSESVTFFAAAFGAPNANFQVTFAGQSIPIIQLGTTANYDIMGGDISAFAGHTGELRFTALPNTGGFLDNIQFLTSPVPEPGTLALAAAGAVLFGLRRWGKSSP
jgi:hypothetical protein